MQQSRGRVSKLSMLIEEQNGVGMNITITYILYIYDLDVVITTKLFMC